MIRVEVAVHFNEDAYSYGLLHGLADRLREVLRVVDCPEHGDEAYVRLSTEGIAQAVNDIRVEVVGCCPAAEREVQRVVDRVREAAEPG